jgi:hypothetical protein
MRSWFFAREYDNPLWADSNLTPEDRYPDRYDDFEDWVEDNVVDGLLEAIENHPNTKDLFETLVSFVSIGVTTEERDGAEFEYSQLRENAADLERETRRTTSLITLNGPGEWLFGPNHQTLFRVKWLDYHDGIDDMVRWEARVQNVELFGDERLAIDQIKGEFTYESAKVKVLKAHPFGLPFLAQASVEADPDDVKWGVMFTVEERDFGRMTDAFLNGERQRRTSVPLQWKFDIGVKGDDDETYVGFVFAGSF